MKCKLSDPIEKLQLPLQVQNALRKSCFEIEVICDLYYYNCKYGTLLNIKNIGIRNLEIINKALERNGLEKIK